MAEKDMNNSIFGGNDPILDLDIKTDIHFSRKDHPEGKMVPVSVGEKQEFILIPLDIKDGTVIKIAGRGKYHPGTGKTGDLYVLVHIEERQFPWKIVLIAAGIVAAVIVIALLMLKAPETPPAPTSTPTAASCVHSWIPADCTTPKTCSQCGETNGTQAGHKWDEATYNAPQTCTVCGETEGKKKEASSSLGFRDIVSNVSASSVYSGDNLGIHVPENLYDGKLDTNWTENASGNGIGEYVIFNFDNTYAVNKLRIYIGSHYSEEVYQNNCRPKVISLTFSDGSTELVYLEDSYDEQVITLSQYYYTDSIKLTIEDVYSGRKYLDTVIAELDFVAYNP